MTIGSTVIAAVTDWIFALLPIWMMWSLRMSMQKKIIVCFLLGLGAWYVRTYFHFQWCCPLNLLYILGLARRRSFVFHIWSSYWTTSTFFVCQLHVHFPSYKCACANESRSKGDTTDIAIWSVIELGVGIIVISLPSCRPILRSIPFFAAMSSANSNNTPNKHPDRTRPSWPSQPSLQKGSLKLRDLESSTGGHSRGDVETFMSDNSVLRDAEEGMEKTAVAVSCDFDQELRSFGRKN